MPTRKRVAQRVINCVAPIRICDLGGWTDTWFARHGRIFNIGVYPYAEAQIEVFPYEGQEDRIVIHAENFGQRYVVKSERLGWDRHPLLEAAIEYMRVPADLAFQVTIFSIGALDSLTPGRMTPHEVAGVAQRIETEMLKQQCGIQDQLCSAYGGINYIDMFEYPHASVSQISIPNSTWWELERRLVLVYLGRSHSSSKVHELVIRELENAGPDCRKLEDLRTTAPQARDALYAGDFDALGRTMIANTEAQRRLHPALVSQDAERIIAIARAHGALGWKVNGAGGEGGSVTLLGGPLSYAKRAMIREIEQDNRLFKIIPIYLSRHGLRVWERAATP